MIKPTLEYDEIKGVVRRRYSAFAAGTGGRDSCCSAAATAATGYAADLGLYSAEDLARVPEGALNLSRGCGNPTGFASLDVGDVVVDLGCGGGIDVILAAFKVRPGGMSIGVDMSQDMIERAAQNVADAGLDEREVRLYVADLANTGLPEGCADVLISNCVINLCPDKQAVYHEAFRLLRPGGRLAVSDVVIAGKLRSELEASLREKWSGCVGGALPEAEYFDILGGAGFENFATLGAHVFTGEELKGMSCCPGPEFAPPPPAWQLAELQNMVRSIKFTAQKPGTHPRVDSPSGR